MEINKKVYSEIYHIEEIVEKKWKESEDISLMIGNGGTLLFYDSLYNLTNDSKYFIQTERILEDIFTTFNNTKNHINYSFCTGLSGLAYSFHTLSRTNSIWKKQLTETLIIFDKLILDFIENRIYSINEIDFLHGSLGICYYLNERIKSNISLQPTTLVVIEKTCRILDDFFKRQNSLEKDLAIESYAFGLAHGCASLIVVLAKVLINNPNNDVIKKTLATVINYLLKFKSNDSKNLSVFPSNLFGEIGYNTPLSWCRGDQGIAHSLFVASESLNDGSLYREANSIALRTLRRDNLEKSVFSTEDCAKGLCHGISSIALLHKKLFFHTGNKDFLKIHNHLTKELLQRNSTYLYAEEPVEIGKKKFTHDITLLNGLTGIGLFYIDFLKKDSCKNLEGVFL